MTWAMIVGEDNVMDVRRLDMSTVGPVKAMSVMGSMSADLASGEEAPAVAPPDGQL